MFNLSVLIMWINLVTLSDVLIKLVLRDVDKNCIEWTHARIALFVTRWACRYTHSSILKTLTALISAQTTRKYYWMTAPNYWVSWWLKSPFGFSVRNPSYNVRAHPLVAILVKILLVQVFLRPTYRQRHQISSRDKVRIWWKRNLLSVLDWSAPCKSLLS